MLPGANTAAGSKLVDNVKDGHVICANLNANNLAIISGSDQDLGTIEFISDADTVDTLLVGTTDNKGASGTEALPSAYTSAKLNNNAHATNTEFDINAKTTNLWLIGAAKLEAILKFGLAKKADWTTARGLIAICDN